MTDSSHPREERMRAALQRIKDGGTCQCEHDTKDCCAETEFHCPECIAARALAESPSPSPVSASAAPSPEPVRWGDYEEAGYALERELASYRPGIVWDAATRDVIKRHLHAWAEQQLSTLQQQIDEMVSVLKPACDRSWERETPIQVANIAADAIHWRDVENRKLRAQLDTLTKENERLKAAERAALVMGYEAYRTDTGWDFPAADDPRLASNYHDRLFAAYRRHRQEEPGS